MNKGFTLFRYRVGFYSSKLPWLKTVGMVNETEDHWFVPFLDYDFVDYRIVQEDLAHLNKVFGLCSFLVVCTEEKKIEGRMIGHYSVFGFDKLSFQDWIDVLEHTRSDFAFKRINNYRRWHQRNWVIRISDKLDKNGKVVRPMQHLKEVVKFQGKCKFKHSLAHNCFLEKYFNCKIQLSNMDGCRNVEFLTYKTR